MFQAARKTVVIFGGASGGTAQDSTWRWIGSTWRKVQAAQSPLAREGAGAACDAALGHSIVFGVQNNTTLLNDTWEPTVAAKSSVQ